MLLGGAASGGCALLGKTFAPSSRIVFFHLWLGEGGWAKDWSVFFPT